KTVTLTVDGKQVTAQYRGSGVLPESLADIQLEGAPNLGQHYLLYQGKNGEYIVRGKPAGGAQRPGEEEPLTPERMDPSSAFFVGKEGLIWVNAGVTGPAEVNPQQSGTFEVNAQTRTIKLTVGGQDVTARVQGYDAMPALADIQMPSATTDDPAK